MVATGRTVDGRVPHSLHAHFLRPTRHDAPLDWAVSRERDQPGIYNASGPESAVNWQQVLESLSSLSEKPVRFTPES